MNASAQRVDDTYDAIVIGAGQAGPGLARYLAGDGQRVTLVEADKVGGTCLNRGCRPTKAMRASARIAHIARRAADYGVSTGEISVDFAAVIARKDEMVDGWLESSTESLAGVDGLELIFGDARFSGRSDDGFTVTVAERTIATDTVFLNVGTRATVPTIDGLDEIDWLDNDRVLHLDELPSHLVILGGGYIALELGQMFARFGSDVTIIERGDRVAGREDANIADELAAVLTAEGVVLRTGTTVERVEALAVGVRVHVSDGAPIDASHLLVAIGRTPNTDRLELDRIGLTTDARGFIATDGVFRTAVEGVWALGDINGRGAFTHTSYQDYEILIDHLGAVVGRPTGGSRPTPCSPIRHSGGSG